MKVEIEIDDLETFAKALNNACIAYYDLTTSIEFGLHPQISGSKFIPLTKLPEEELRKRREILFNVYEQIERIEKNG